MSQPSNRGSSDFSLDNTADRNSIRKQQSEPRHMSPQEVAAPEGEYYCPRCRAVWSKKAWRNDDRRFVELEKHPDLARQCPACKRELHDLPEGIVTLSGLDGWPKERRAELLGLVANVGERARKRDPMDRIMKVQDRGTEVLIHTTENQLAVAIGKEVKRAFSGDLNIDFGNRDSDIARVIWIAKPA
jgi:NMD protein affecting ribosome stability and mRNA decay